MVNKVVHQHRHFACCVLRQMRCSMRSALHCLFLLGPAVKLCACLLRLPHSNSWRSKRNRRKIEQSCGERCCKKQARESEVALPVHGSSSSSSRTGSASSSASSKGIYQYS